MSKYHIVAAIALAVTACTSPAPSSPKGQASLEDQANATLGEMFTRAPELHSLLNSSAGYAVFPSVGAAGAFVAGGAYGKGVLYENGYPVGFVSLSQGSIGPQLGGQTFSELLVLRTPYDVQNLKAGNFKLGGEASAVILNAGVAAAGSISAGRTVFVYPKGGLMASLSVSGQQINFQPRG
jgi:lipid-binding SYLF domain-containing protein